MSFHLGPEDFNHGKSCAVASLALGVGDNASAKQGKSVVWSYHFLLVVLYDSLNTVDETGRSRFVYCP